MFSLAHKFKIPHRTTPPLCKGRWRGTRRRDCFWNNHYFKRGSSGTPTPTNTQYVCANIDFRRELSFPNSYTLPFSKFFWYFSPKEKYGRVQSIFKRLGAGGEVTEVASCLELCGFERELLVVSALLTRCAEHFRCLVDNFREHVLDYL